MVTIPVVTDWMRERCKNNDDDYDDDDDDDDDDIGTLILQNVHLE